MKLYQIFFFFKESYKCEMKENNRYSEIIVTVNSILHVNHVTVLNYHQLLCSGDTEEHHLEALTYVQFSN